MSIRSQKITDALVQCIDNATEQDRIELLNAIEEYQECFPRYANGLPPMWAKLMYAIEEAAAEM